MFRNQPDEEKAMRNYMREDDDLEQRELEPPGKGFRWFLLYASAILLAILVIALWPKDSQAQTVRASTISFARPTKYVDGTDIAANTSLSYRVLQGLKGHPKTQVGVITGTSTTINSGLAGGAEYCWQVVVMIDGRPDSDPSNEGCKAFPASAAETVTITVI